MRRRGWAASASALALIVAAGLDTGGCSRHDAATEVKPEPRAPKAAPEARSKRPERIPELGSLDASQWINGPPVSLKSLHGSVVLIETWSQFCTLCKASVPAVTTLQKRYADKGVEVLGVARYEGEPGEREAIAKTMEDVHMTYRSYLDRGLTWHRAAKVEGSYPYFYVVGKHGGILLRESGRIVEGSEAFARIVAAIEKGLGVGQ